MKRFSHPTLRAIATGLGIGCALIACARFMTDDRAFKASLKDAAHGLAQGLKHHDSSEVLVWVMPEERQGLQLTPSSMTALLDWYKACGGVTEGVEAIRGQDSSLPPETFRFGWYEISDKTKGQTLAFQLEDGSRGFRANVTGSLVAQGIEAKYGRGSVLPSKHFLERADQYRTEAPALEAIGIDGEWVNGRLHSWHQVAEGMENAAAISRARGR